MRALAGLTCGMLLAFTAGSNAADEITCALYGENVEQLVKQLTNDDDVSQAARNRAEAYCVVIDEPIDIKVQTTPISLAPPPSKPKWDPEWVAKCKKYYGSFREADGTVLRRGSKKRSKCPQ